MRKALFILLAIGSFVIVGCQSTTKSSQQATATAFANAHMIEAMEAAEEGALALCALDLDAGPEVYADNICAVSTELACILIKEELNDSWEEMQSEYPTRKTACAASTSRLLEVGEQYGKKVQFWMVNLKGVQGFNGSSANQVYWLQVSEENGHWKFNRLLSDSEISLYLAIEKIDSERR